MKKKKILGTRPGCKGEFLAAQSRICKGERSRICKGAYLQGRVMRRSGTGKEIFQKIPWPTVQQGRHSIEDCSLYFLTRAGVSAPPAIELSSRQGIVD